MAIEWITGRAVTLTCPVCGAAGPKPAHLSVESAVHNWARLTLVQCPDCRSAFYDDLTPARYQDYHSSGPLNFHVEQGAGVDVMLAPLFRFRPERVRRYLEVGCGFGYSLDFARFAFGWQVRGIDPSSVAAAGREALKLDIVPAYLTLDTDFGGTTFDLILCSELIEHVPSPHELLTVVRRVLAEEGALTLTTPNAAAIDPETTSGALLNIVAPGHHLILFSKASLELVLKANGFAHVQIWEYPHTLHAVASRHAYPVLHTPVVDRALYRRYLVERSATTSVETPVGLGFAYRLYKECVCAGDFSAAQPVFERLRAAYSATHGIDLSAPESIGCDLSAARDFDRFAETHAFNLTGVLFFRGMTEMNHRTNYRSALQYFTAAARAGVAIRTALRSIGADDGETEDLVAQARIHALYCLAHVDPATAVAEWEALSAGPRPGDPPPEVWRVPATLLPSARAELFVRLVSAAHYPEAARLAYTVQAMLGPSREAKAGPALSGLERDRDTVLKCLFSLGMLALNHQGTFRMAARLFGLVYRLARRACAARRPSPVAATLIWQARYHQAVALQRAGDQRACETAARTIVDERPTGLPRVAESILAAVRALVR